MNDLTVRVLQRWIQVLQEEWGNWVQAILQDTFNPGVMLQFLKSMGIDLSQLPGMAASQMTLDPYLILGLNKSATDEEVKKRYRELLHKLHPDTSGTEGTAFLFQMVLWAYKKIESERGWQ